MCDYITMHVCVRGDAAVSTHRQQKKVWGVELCISSSI